MLESAQCTGCGACAAACSCNAISMKPDADGFLHPLVDTERCSGCGKCRQVCPVIHAPVCSAPEQVFLVAADDLSLRRKSSSGGLFTILAEPVIRDGGMVFGCAMAADCCSAYHVGVASLEELNRLRGSKYIQSDTQGVYRQVRDVLRQGRRVLFTGTPCQTAGLNRYLSGENIDRLLTVDMICHGVPSPMVWREYLKELETEYASKAVEVSFRDKAEGWQQYSLKCRFCDGSEYRGNVLHDLYLRGFIENAYLRPCCHECRFKGNGYASDITMGDFWGAAELFDDLKAAQGVSLLVAHTVRGRDAAGMLRGCRIETVSAEKALKHNPSYFRATMPSPFRKTILNKIRTHGAKKTLRKYCGFGLEPKIRKKLAAWLGWR